MYAMVDALANLLPNLNQAYMAGLMTAPMIIIELLIMRQMYERHGLNLAILAGSARVRVRDPRAGRHRRPRVSEIDDPASCRRHPDVRGGADRKSGHQEAVQCHYCKPAGRDRPDEGNAAQQWWMTTSSRIAHRSRPLTLELPPGISIALRKLEEHMATRKIEIFSAGCGVCQDVVEQAKAAACPSCDVTVVSMTDAGIAARARSLGIRSLPAVVIDGKLAGCCVNGGVDLDVLRAAGLGRAG